MFFAFLFHAVSDKTMKWCFPNCVIFGNDPRGILNVMGWRISVWDARAGGNFEFKKFKMEIVYRTVPVISLEFFHLIFPVRIFMLYIV